MLKLNKLIKFSFSDCFESDYLHGIKVLHSVTAIFSDILVLLSNFRQSQGTKMHIPLHLTPTLTLTCALTFFVISVQYPVCANSDAKRRQRHLFNILTSSDSQQIVSANGTMLKIINSAEKNSDGSDIGLHDAKPTKAPSSKEDKIRSSEPPLVGGRDTYLTLSLLGKFRKTWCKTEPYMQLIKEPGCLSRKVLNRFCYGQCNSFYIPRTLRKGKGQRVFKSCGVCKPRRTQKIRVTLTCPGRRKGYKHKHVKQIKQCRCMESNNK